MECQFCSGQCSYGETDMGIEIKMIGDSVRIQGYNPMGWRKEVRYQISFCPLCGRAVGDKRERERGE